MKPIIGCTTYTRPFSAQSTLQMYGTPTTYVEAIQAAGGIPMLIPLGLSQKDLAAIFARIDGLLLPGGGDVSPDVYRGKMHDKVSRIDEKRDKTELWLAQKAVAEQKPTLAICRGHQVLNVALGGTLWEDVADLLPGAIRHDFFKTFPRDYLAHSVSVAEDSLLARLVGTQETAVNSLHHQGIRDLAPELVATAVAPDGLVEAVEIPSHPFALGVQWHPENLIKQDEKMLSIFKGFIQAAAENGRMQ